MARGKKKATISFDALTVEGALIAPAMLAKITLREAGGQAEADYKVPKGLTIRDEIARYFRIGQAQYKALASASMPSTSAAVRFAEDLLRDVFGFNDLQRPGIRSLDGHNYAVTLEGLGGRVPVIVVPPSDDLDRASDHLPAMAAVVPLHQPFKTGSMSMMMRSGACAVTAKSCALCATMPASPAPPISKLTCAKCSKVRALQISRSFAAAHASRFGTPGSSATDCALERWREAGAKEGLAARDRLRDGVELALILFVPRFPHR